MSDALDIKNAIEQANRPSEPTLLDTLASAKHIVPTATRRAIKKSLKDTTSAVSSAGQSVFSLAGKGLWLATSVFFVLVFPLAMEVDRELQLQQLDKEQAVRSEMSSPFLNNPGVAAAAAAGGPAPPAPSK